MICSGVMVEHGRLNRYFLSSVMRSNQHSTGWRNIKAAPHGRASLPHHACNNLLRQMSDYWKQQQESSEHLCTSYARCQKSSIWSGRSAIIQNMFLVIVEQWSVGGCYGEILDESMKKDMIVPSTSSNVEPMASHGFVFRKLAKIQRLGHSVLKQGPQAVKCQLTSHTTGLVTSIWRVLGCP